MKIECILKRDGGTHTSIGNIQYHFEPVADGAHISDVADEGHIDRFLSISEAYKVYHGKCEPKGKPKSDGPVKQAAPVVAPEMEAKAPLAGSDLHPPQFEIGGQVITQLDVVRKAFEASGMTSDEWNELGEDDRAARMDIVLDEMAEAADLNHDGVVDGKDERISLIEAYKAKFGKAPNGRKSNATILAELGV